MLTNDLSNNNTPSSAPPPPPLPLGGLKNWTLPQDNGNGKKSSNVATSGISSCTEPKKKVNYNINVKLYKNFYRF
ncbi:hypothetical protein [Wolbachia endosymbiont of Trichogramma kaykai]|uniref:hypothetical protein n=1 Tax=Wolbachia endosymbiont of Trichogramma kaykai TaxID=444066 RepID=UPI0038920484